MIALDNENHSNQTWGTDYGKLRVELLNKLIEIYSNTNKNACDNIKNQEIAYKCAYGILLRHAMECILHDKVRECGVFPQGRTADELIQYAIDNSSFNKKTKKIFDDIRRVTNNLTHINHFTNPKIEPELNHFTNQEITFESCQEFYNDNFKEIIEDHLYLSQRNQDYLHLVYIQLENFDLNNSLTSTLLLGNIMRQISECLVDLWRYNEESENGESAGIFKKIEDLRTGNRKYITTSTIDNLHTIRKAVNQAMHVPSDNSMDVSKIRSNLNKQTYALHDEIKRFNENVEGITPDEEHITVIKNHSPWTTVLKWILFFPILIPIKIGKSQMGTLKKVILIYLSISLITCPVIFGLFEVLPKYIKEKTSTVITIDVEDMTNQLIWGYNHYGCFVSDEFSETQTLKDETYTIKIKKDSVLEDGTLLALTINQDDDVVGTASIKAIHEQYLSNGDEIRFEVGEEIEGHYQIELTETTISVKNLDDTEIIRNDPREHLKLVFSHKVTESLWTYNWNKIELSKSEYDIGDKTIRLSVIEDKRPGAEEVNPGLKFEVFDSNKKSIAVGEYIFAKLQYDANYDDYGKMYANSFDLAPNFDQAEMLTKTGILFIDTVSTYKF